MLSREDIEKELQTQGIKRNDFLKWAIENNVRAYALNPDTNKEEEFIITGFYENGDLNGYFMSDLNLH